MRFQVRRSRKHLVATITGIFLGAPGVHRTTFHHWTTFTSEDDKSTQIGWLIYLQGNLTLSNELIIKTDHRSSLPLCQSDKRRARARNVNFETLYDGQFTLSTQWIILNYPVILSHRRRTTVSLETHSLYDWYIDRWITLFIRLTEILLHNKNLTQIVILTCDTWTDRPLTNLLSTVITASGETIVPHRQQKVQLDRLTASVTALLSHVLTWLFYRKTDKRLTIQIYKESLIPRKNRYYSEIIKNYL